jgi:magnesium-protoporphyrin IX monomethyl ester (oxidative) cyclase
VAVVAARNTAPDLLRPRLYKTDVPLLNSLDVNDCRAEFTALREEFERDYNRAHFKWDDDVKDIDYSPLWNEFYEFLNRSALGEFSGCLLYSDVQKHIDDKDVAMLYRCMGRDEGRHSSFLNWVMRDMGRPFDLANLPKLQKMQYMHPKWIFVTTYLSEIIGFYRYQNISDHLHKRPEFAFHPLFKYFDKWCNDERRHSRFFALMMRSQPQFQHGWRNQLGTKVFALAVYITMYLRDCEAPIYPKLGIDWEKYDTKVINETEAAGRRVWGLAIRTNSRYFLARLRQMRRNNLANKRGRAATGAASSVALGMRYLRYADNILQILLLIAQPHDRVPVAERKDWLETPPDPADVSGIALAGAVPTILPRTLRVPTAVPA